MDEVKLVWGAPRSFAKHAFLVNRYIVLGCMLAVAYGEYSLNYQILYEGANLCLRDVRFSGRCTD